MIRNTEEWIKENKVNFDYMQLKRLDEFEWIGGHDRFYNGICSCCGQYADKLIEDVKTDDDEHKGYFRVTYKCVECTVNGKHALDDDELEKIKEEVPEDVNRQAEEDLIKWLEAQHKPENTEEDNEFFEKLFSEVK